MNKQQRQKRIVAVGELTNHCHAFVGEGIEHFNDKGEIIAFTPTSDECFLGHIGGREWIEKGEIIYKEHKPAPLKKWVTYNYVPQCELNPMKKIVERVRD